MSDWAGLVGKSGEQAKTIILQEDPNFDVKILP